MQVVHDGILALAQFVYRAGAEAPDLRMEGSPFVHLAEVEELDHRSGVDVTAFRADDLRELQERGSDSFPSYVGVEHPTRIGERDGPATAHVADTEKEVAAQPPGDINHGIGSRA